MKNRTLDRSLGYCKKNADHTDCKEEEKTYRKNGLKWLIKPVVFTNEIPNTSNFSVSIGKVLEQQNISKS